jgi:hypothetical protein
MSQAVVWVHAGCLNPYQAALTKNQERPAIFIWDERLLRRRAVSLKRILFIYECLLDLPVVIRRGAVAEELIAFAREHEADEIITMFNVSPGFARNVRVLQDRDFHITILQEEPFVDFSEKPDLRRFSRYWRAAQPQLAFPRSG